MARYMVIDDDEHIVQLLEAKLKREGHEVFKCYEARQAFSFVKEVIPEVVILDVLLRDGIGYEISRKIRRDPELYKIPILFHSVAGEDRDISHAMEEGGDAYLVKPYSSKQLDERLGELQLLADRIEHRCPQTRFHSIEAMRREVDHRLFRGEDFALCYAFADGLAAYRKVHTRALSDITLATACAIRDAITNGGFYETFCAHLGGGYFMITVHIDDRKRFPAVLQDSFQHRRSAEEATSSPRSSEGDGHAARLDIAVAHTDGHHYRYAFEMFDRLRKADAKDKQRGEHLVGAGESDHWID